MGIITGDRVNGAARWMTFFGIQFQPSELAKMAVIIVTAFILFWIETGVVYKAGTTDSALYQLLSGGLLLGAFFMATDYVTCPITKWGRVIMGIGCAAILFLIRTYGSYPEGCSFGILFMNVMTPLIDKWTTPKTFGAVKPVKKGGAKA